MGKERKKANMPNLTFLLFFAFLLCGVDTIQDISPDNTRPNENHEDHGHHGHHAQTQDPGQTEDHGHHGHHGQTQDQEQTLDRGQTENPGHHGHHGQAEDHEESSTEDRSGAPPGPHTMVTGSAAVQTVPEVHNEHGEPSYDEPEEMDEQSLENTIETILLQLRNNSAISLPGVDIPDPMPIPDFENRVEQGLTNADIQLWNLTIAGLSSFILDEVNVNLANMDVTVGMNLSSLYTKGMYNLKGKFSFFRLSGKGEFWMQIGGAYVSGNIILRVNDDGILEVANVNLDCTVSDIKLHFQNLFGGGVMSSFTNTILNALSKILFDSVKPAIIEELQNTMRRVLNEKFEDLPPQPMLARSASPLDVALANAAAQIRNSDLDPFPLPDYVQNFNRRIFFVRVFGNITMSEGYLRGLSTLHRTGEIRVQFKDNSLNATAQLGFDNMEGGYKWEANFMGLSRKGGVHFLVKSLGMDLVVTQANELGTHPQIQSLGIPNINRVALDMDGLGSFDYLMEFFTNLFGNIFKKQFSRIAEKQIRQIIQENLNKVRLPY